MPGDFGMDGNLTADTMTGFAGAITFGAAEEVANSLDASDVVKVSTKLAGVAVAVTIEAVDIVDAAVEGDLEGVAEESAGLAGALGGAYIFGQLGALSGNPIVTLGAAAIGAYVGESEAEKFVTNLLDDGSYRGDPGEVNDHLPNVSPNTPVVTVNTSTGDQVAYYDDPVNEVRVRTTVELDPETGGADSRHFNCDTKQQSR